MIGKFKKTFETIYLNEICFLVYVYVYLVLYIQETYMETYLRNNTNH